MPVRWGVQTVCEVSFSCITATVKQQWHVLLQYYDCWLPARYSTGLLLPELLSSFLFLNSSFLPYFTQANPVSLSLISTVSPPLIPTLYFAPSSTFLDFLLFFFFSFWSLPSYDMLLHLCSLFFSHLSFINLLSASRSCEISNVLWTIGSSALTCILQLLSFITWCSWRVEYTTGCD